MTMEQSYEHYFESGHYDERYPTPNAVTLRAVRAQAPAGSSVLDIGAGSGRYALPLAADGYTVHAVERSDSAREKLLTNARARGLEGRLRVVKDLADADESVLRECGAALLLFGVLGHMSFSERQAVLTRLAAAMAPGSRLVGSVPNRYRRFLREQMTARLVDDGARAPRVRYSRQFGGTENALEYTAFSPRSLRAELTECGWGGIALSSESLFSERSAIGGPSSLPGRVDRLACRILPVRLSYCMLYTAQLG